MGSIVEFGDNRHYQQVYLNIQTLSNIINDIILNRIYQYQYVIAKCQLQQIQFS